MPPETVERDENSQGTDQTTASNSIFTVPAPIKRLFDKFPLRSYPANELPLRVPQYRDQHVLYVFSTPDGAAKGAPSYNPGCLKWQTYLKFCRIDFRLTASNNHASPSGALPFLLPPALEYSKPSDPVPSAKLQKWATGHSQSVVEEPSDLRYEAYLSLIDHRIRRAWLYTLYLTSNFTSIAEPLYILPPSNNSFVRLAIARELRAAAENELLKYSAVIDEENLYREAEEAVAALEMVLGDSNWFFDADGPGLFDASVFAYTHLLLDDELGNGWVEPRLRNAVLQSKRLVAHRNRVLARYYSGA